MSAGIMLINDDIDSYSDGAARSDHQSGRN